MKTVLVTGASGFIGRHAIEPLVHRGFEVHAVTSRNSRELAANCTWHVADLLDIDHVGSLVELVRPSHLLHLAWYAIPGQYWTSHENFRWVQASLELLRRFHRLGGERVVMAGTCAEYDWDYGYCSELITPTTPTTTYGTCKLALCNMLAAYAREAQLSSAWGRIFMLYGPYEHPSRLVSSVACALLRGEIARCTHGHQLRDFLHVQDVADAFVALLSSAVTGPINVASGRPIAVKDVVYKLADYVGRRDLVKLDAIPVAPHEPRLLCGDIGRLCDEVGWSPQYDLDSGLQHTLNWWENRLTAGAA